MPAALIAAAVRLPDTADATDKPAKMRVITIIRTAPIGVLIMLIMEPVAPFGISDPPVTETVASGAQI